MATTTVTTCDRCGIQIAEGDAIRGVQLQLSVADVQGTDVSLDIQECCMRCYGGAYKLVETFAGKYRGKSEKGETQKESEA